MFRSRGVYGDGGSQRRGIVGRSIYSDGSVAATYIDKVLGYAPLVYYPMNETAGVVADNLGSLGAAGDGAYTGVTLNNAVGPDGVNGTPFFDGANDDMAPPAALDAAFNGATGTFAVWFRVANAGVWTDGTIRYVARFRIDGDNQYLFTKSNANNLVVAYGEAGNGTAQTTAAYSATTWTHYAVTWSDSANADEFKFFINGAQQGVTSAALNAWVGGALGVDYIGASAAATSVWHGWLAHAAIWASVLTPAQILDLATV